MLWSDRRIRLITTKEHTGAMVALMLDVSDSAALLSALPPGLEPETDLHITLAYLGDAASLTRQQSDDIDRILADVGSYREPVTGTVQGIGYFNQDEASQRVLWAAYDAPNLPDLRQSIVKGLEAYGLPVDDTHGFTPHITLAYCPDSVDLTVPEIPNLKITFHSLTRMFAGDRADFLLSGTPGFMVKEIGGQYNWVLISSNSYQDRDGEIVTQKALEDDVERADSDGDYGPLLWWHEKDIVLGQCTGNAMHDRMLVEWGTFKSAEVAERVKDSATTLGVSIGFKHPVLQPDPDGLFHNIKRFERSVLPYSVASNPLTAIPLIHLEEPIMLKEKIDALKKVFGGDEVLVNSVISLADSHQKAADEAGIRTKAASEVKCPHCGAMNAADAKTCTACGKPMDAKAADAAPPVENKEYVGDMEPAALKALINDAVTGHILGLKAELQTQLDTQATTKEASDRAYAESVKSLDAKLDGIAKSAKSALDGVAELKGELPRALGERLKGWRASEKGDDPPDELKSQEPAPDPMEKHWKAIQATAGIHAPTA